MTGLGCNTKDVSEEGCDSQGLLSGCQMGEMGDICHICHICHKSDIRDIHT